MIDSILMRVAALKALPIPALKQQWRELFETEPPPYNRRFLEHRLAYGTRLIREYQGTEHCVTVRDEDYEYQGRPYKSLSALARAITGTRWNGLLFFGLKNRRAPS